MDTQYVRNIQGILCKFLENTDLKGREVPAYSEVWNFSQALGVGEFSVIETPTLKELQEQAVELVAFRKAAARWKSVEKRFCQIVEEEKNADASEG